MKIKSLRGKPFVSFLTVTMLLTLLAVSPGFAAPADKAVKDKDGAVSQSQILNRGDQDLPDAAKGLKKAAASDGETGSVETILDQPLLPALEFPALLPLETEQSGEGFLVQFRPGTPAELKRSINASCGVKEMDSIPGINVHVLATPAGRSVEEMVQLYRNNPNVIFAEPDFVATALVTPNDPYFAAQQYGLANTDAVEAWDVSLGSADITVAILDTGIDFNHLDLRGRTASGYDFVNRDSDAMDDAGHGTNVAGIIGAATHNTFGMAGITWLNPLVSVKVLDDFGSGMYSTIAEGIVFAADQGAKVINMSFGGVNPSDTLLAAVQYAQGKGVVMVAAAGNNGSAVMYPAAYPQVIAVGAVDSSDIRPSLSCFGPELAVTAPGVQVLTTKMDTTHSGYASVSGTSFAAPYVSGLAALLLSADPSLTTDQVREMIQKGAEDLGAEGFDPYYGYGRINMANTMALLGISSVRTVVPEPQPAPEPDPSLAVDPEIITTVQSGTAPASRFTNIVSHMFTLEYSGHFQADLVWTQRKCDLKLSLYDADGAYITSVDSSSTTNLAESLSQNLLPGTYRLNVEAVSGKSSYTLTVTRPQ